MHSKKKIFFKTYFQPPSQVAAEVCGRQRDEQLDLGEHEGLPKVSCK